MPEVLVTGGSGFFGGILKRQLLDRGFSVTNLDLVRDPDQHPALTSVRGDLRDPALLDSIFASHRFAGVFHIAAMLAHGGVSKDLLWTSNVDGTRNLAEAARKHGVRKLVFTSSNCLWGHNLGHPVREDDPPAPVELYGESKLAGEKVLAEYSSDLDVVTLRCPTIISSGRLGLLAILFEFIQEGRTVWVVGDGSNRYQFIYALDLAHACILALDYSGSDLFHIGSDNVQSLREVYETVIRKAGTRSRVRSLPKGPTLAAMRLAHNLHLSELGPYHYRMIAEDFLFDTTKIRERLGWQPTLSNADMLSEAYEYYARSRREIESRQDVSAHNRAASMGIIRLLKWLS
ncbi:MAG TPA: NAD(P)-dependent oxidoreductase [Acidobacteriaceae bacterium]|nr:NAD(P)-dependent oxidoreductase [Acidobacteriaceae bacterium]